MNKKGSFIGLQINQSQQYLKVQGLVKLPSLSCLSRIAPVTHTHTAMNQNRVHLHLISGLLGSDGTVLIA